MHLHAFDDGGKTHYLHKDVVGAWREFQADAAQAGFAPVVISAYRGFERQLAIWNAKASGQRQVLDDADKPVVMAGLEDIDKIHAIMRFTALPGASRHHWGTDFDIVDMSVVDADYDWQLTLAETQGDGPCANFYQWLAEYQPADFAFKRPYLVDTGGIAIEPWHFSHRAAAAPFEAMLSAAAVKAVISGSELALKACVLANFDELYERYIGAGGK